MGLHAGTHTTPGGSTPMRRRGRQLATGATAEVFAWGDHDVLKLFHRGIPASVADREAAQARIARGAGVPTPAVVDVITLEGRAGVVFERIDGPTMLERLSDEPATMDALAGRLAVLHVDLHARRAPGLPAQRQRLRVSIVDASGLTDGMKAAAVAALDKLPDGEALCHGDFHPGNVIMTSGSPVIIDWLDATRGHPLGDVARTSLLVNHAAVPGPSHLGSAIRGLRAAFHAAYVRRYAETRPIDAGALEAWTLPVAAARLAEPMSAAEREILVSLVARALARA